MSSFNSYLNSSDLSHSSTFDTGLKIFTLLFFIGLFCWMSYNDSTEIGSNQLATIDKKANTKIHLANYANTNIGFDLSKFQTKLNQGIGIYKNYGVSTPLPEKVMEVLPKIAIPEIIAVKEKTKEVIPQKSEPYTLNKSLSNNNTTGPSDLFKAIVIPKKEEIELVDGSELLIISLNEMHILKLPTNKKMTFTKSDNNEFSDESKVKITPEEKKATLDAVKEVVKGDELAFISANELDEIKIVEVVEKEDVAKSNNINTTEFAIKGLNDRSEVLYNALEVATAEEKVVMISFGAKWCFPCKQMYKKVFPDPEVKSLIKNNYVYLKMDANDLEAISIKQIYDVKAYPTTLFLRPNGEELDRYEEGISRGKMITILNENTISNHPELSKTGLSML